jgi:hypothetical protein
MTTAPEQTYRPQHYRLSARDKTGQLLGKSTLQLAVLGVAVVLGVLCAMIRGPMLVGLPVAALIAGVGVAPWRHQRPLVEQLGALAAYAVTPKQWSATLDLLGSDAKAAQLPPEMDGLVLHQMVDAKGGDVALVEDRRVGHLSAAVRVTGRRFALATIEEQDRMLADWAAALTPFGRRGGPVVALSWSSWASPTRIEAHRAWMAEVVDEEASPEAVASYEEVLEATGAHAFHHEVLVTLTVSTDRAARRPGQRHGPRNSAARREVAGAALLREVSLFSDRLAAAGLDASGPLSGPELARALRERLDPTALARLDERGRSAGDVAGLVSPANAGPLHCHQHRTSWRTDGTLHRALVVSEWPRTAVLADWMGSFLLDTACVRGTTVVFEPLDPVASTRQVEFALANHEGDISHRQDKRRVVSGQVRRRGENIERREAQLLDGHVEFRFVGLVVVSAPDEEALDLATEQVVQAGARCRMELRPVDGQHAAATVCALPLGRIPKRASA